jgi:pimeloyl-ACP methyl ester carboxylesterase
MIRKKILVGLIALLVPVAGGAVYVGDQVLNRVEGDYFDSAGVRIHFTDAGEGTPVILVHGFAVNADWNWRTSGVIDALLPEYRVIALDNRGHGLSDKPHDPEAYGDEMVKDVVRLMDHLEIEKAHVIGYSMGGFITLKLATMFPDRLLTATPCASGWIAAEGENMKLLEDLATGLEEEQTFAPLFAKLSPSGKASAFKVSVGDRFLGQFNDTLALAALMHQFDELAVTEAELKALKVPMLSIAGTRDPLREGVDNMIGVAPDLEPHFIEWANHTTTVRHWDFCDIILDYLHRHPAVDALEGAT